MAISGCANARKSLEWNSYVNWVAGAAITYSMGSSDFSKGVWNLYAVQNWNAVHKRSEEHH